MNWDGSRDGRGKPGGLADELSGQPPSGGLADWGSFEAKHERMLVCGADATPAQRLAWLEEVLHIAWQAGALPRRRPPER